MKLCITVKEYDIAEEPSASLFHPENKEEQSNAKLVTFRHTLRCHFLENCILHSYSDVCKSHLFSVPVIEFT
jgi:hypothetical protein